MGTSRHEVARAIAAHGRLGAAGHWARSAAVSQGGIVGGGLHKVVHTVGGLVSGALGAAFSVLGHFTGKAFAAAASSLFDEATSWAGHGAVYLLGGLGRLMSSTTAPQVGTHYFSKVLGVVAVAGAAVALPLLLLTAAQAVVQQDGAILVRAVLVRVPFALLLTGVLVQLVSLSLAATDSFCAAMLHVAGVPTGKLFTGLARLVSAATVATAGVPAVPAFAAFVTALVVAVSALVLWVELAIRSAALEAATLFLPLALAGVIWPATSHWARRLGETLAALVLSKLVIVGVLALAAGQVVASGGGGLAAVVSGISLLLLALLSPFAVFRLVPMLEAGAVGHFAGMGARAGRAVTSGVKDLLKSESRPEDGESHLSTEATAGPTGELDPLGPRTAAEGASNLAAPGYKWNGESIPEDQGGSGDAGGDDASGAAGGPAWPSYAPAGPGAGGAGAAGASGTAGSVSGSSVPWPSAGPAAEAAGGGSGAGEAGE